MIGASSVHYIQPVPLAQGLGRFLRDAASVRASLWMPIVIGGAADSWL
jgi:hypothetical protein